jgi:hypothetical protein
VRSPIFDQLESALAEYLADVSGRARHHDDRTVAALARTELPKLVEAVRAVLAEHSPDQFGRCVHCRRGRWGRTPRPCRAYLSAHLCLITGEDDPTPTEVTIPMRRPMTLGGPASLRRVIHSPG